MKIEVSGDELSDIVNALRSKARGDRAAAGTLVPADPAAVQELARTLIRQAERQESLANRLDDSTPTGGGDVGNSACPKCGQRDADQLLRLAEAAVPMLTDPDADLALMPAELLLQVARKMRQAIRAHRANVGHDLCWYVPELWALLPEGIGAREPKDVPPTAVFLARCASYRRSLEPAPSAGWFSEEKIPAVSEEPT